VNVVGPKVYLNDLQASGFQDPRYLINPALKSGVFDLALNDSFSYADVTIRYDPAKASSPSNLALGYFNTTTGNYTFVPSTVDTVNHTVTARVTADNPVMSSSTIGAIDTVQYHALPVNAQNEMGYIDIGPNDNWTIEDTNLGSFSTIWFGNGVQYPPGNYTIYTSGYYNDAWLGWFVDCGVASTQADQNYGNNLGMQVDYNNPGGSSEVPVSSVRVSSGVLKINHAGGTIGVRNKAYTSSSCCGDVIYRIYYGDGPLFPDNDTAYYSDLNNDQFNATQTGYDLAVTAYQAAAGCVLGQAGRDGGLLDSAHSLIPGWSSAINDDVTNSPAYLVGQVACGMAFPEVTLARDFIADVARGDGIGATLDSLGYIGPVSNLLKENTVLATYFGKNAGRDVEASHELIATLQKEGLTYGDMWAADRYVVNDNIVSFNSRQGNLNRYNPTRGKTVIGSSYPVVDNEPWYIHVGKGQNANTLNLEEWSQYVNYEFLDCTIGNSDEIILATYPAKEGTKYWDEIEYLKRFGYEVSSMPGSDGYYRMVPP
jgi:hypothetical protein